MPANHSFAVVQTRAQKRINETDADHDVQQGKHRVQDRPAGVHVNDIYASLFPRPHLAPRLYSVNYRPSLSPLLDPVNVIAGGVMERHTRTHVATVLTGALVFVVLALIASVVRHPQGAQARPRLFNRHALASLLPRVKGESPRRESEGLGGPDQEQYDNRAYPAAHVSVDRREGARDAFGWVSEREHGKFHGWEEVGPETPNVAGEATYNRPADDRLGPRDGACGFLRAAAATIASCLWPRPAAVCGKRRTRCPASPSGSRPDKAFSRTPSAR